jgi:hypothetical protein
MRLMALHGFALRVAVSICIIYLKVTRSVTRCQYPYKHKRYMARLPSSDQAKYIEDILRETDSALNRWLEHVPDYCKLISVLGLSS